MNILFKCTKTACWMSLFGVAGFLNNVGGLSPVDTIHANIAISLWFYRQDQEAPAPREEKEAKNGVIVNSIYGVLVDPRFQHVFNLTDDQIAKLRSNFKVADAEYISKCQSEVKQLGRDLRNNEKMNISEQVLSAYIYPGLTKENIAKHEAYTLVYSKLPESLYIIGNDAFRVELALTPTQMASADKIYVAWYQEMFNSLFKDTTVFGGLDRFEFFNQNFQKVVELCERNKFNLNEQFKTVFSDSQMKRIKELELQLYVWRNGGKCFLESEIRRDLQLDDSQISYLESLDSIGRGGNAFASSATRKADYKKFVEEILSDDQRLKWGVLLGRPSESIQ